MSEENLLTPKQPSISTANSPLSSGSKCKQSSLTRTVTPTILAYSPSYIAKNFLTATQSTSLSPGNEWPKAPPCSPATCFQSSASYVQPNGDIDLSSALQGLAMNQSVEATPLVLSIDAVDENGTTVTANVSLNLSLSRSGLVSLKPVCVRLNGNPVWREKK